MPCVLVGIDADDHAARNDNTRVDDAPIEVRSRSDHNARSQNRPVHLGVRMNPTSRTDDAVVKLAAD